MQTVIETATGKAIYLFNDAYPATITDKGMTTPDFRALDIKLNTHSIVQNVPHPPTWAGNALTWNGTVWVTLDQAALDAAVEAAKTRRKAELASLRYDHEIGGTTLPDTTAIATDRQSQSLILGAYTRAKADATALFDFKAASGWQTVNAPTMIIIGDAVFAHVQACFSREKALHEAIDAATTVAGVAAVDLTTGWPV